MCWKAAMKAGHKRACPSWPKRSLSGLRRSGRALWVTRRRPKIDRIACPWLIRRFLDPQARILFVDPDQVTQCRARKRRSAVRHQGRRTQPCRRALLVRYHAQAVRVEGEPSLARLALIVRGADTARHDIAAEAAGLHAVSLGLSALAGDDDHGLLQRGFMVYDALFAWLRFAAEERHNWPAKAA